MICDSPNEFLDRWDGNVTYFLVNEQKTTINVRWVEYIVNIIYSPKQLLLRGTKLRNTEYCYGFAVYTGPESKIMMNAKKPPTKVSNVQRKMN